MFPMRTSSVFRSRWLALLWAAGILWFAYDFTAPDDPPAAANNGAATAAAVKPLSAGDQTKIVDALGN